MDFREGFILISYIWFFMVIISIFCGVITGKIGAVSAAAGEGAAAAVDTALRLAGPLCLWCGVGELMRQNGLRDSLSRLLRPLLGRLFPELAKNADGFSALSANVTANLLGLGNAATPMGIAACKARGDGSGLPTREQCRLIVMNTASIQLLPTTVAALRSSLGAQAPLDILPAVLLTSLVSVCAGLSACLLLERRDSHGR